MLDFTLALTVSDATGLDPFTNATEVILGIDQNATASISTAGSLFVGLSLLAPLYLLAWASALVAAASAAAAGLPVLEGPWAWLSSKFGQQPTSYGRLDDARNSGADDHDDGDDGVSASHPVHFHKLSYSIKGSGGDERKSILRSVSGCIEPGQLTAVLGPSGCGKTTLLSLLAHRGGSGGSGASFSGFRIVDGEPLPPERYAAFARSQVGFVPQDDTALLFPELTVGESLALAAFLRLPDDDDDAAWAPRLRRAVRAHRAAGLEGLWGRAVGGAGAKARGARCAVYLFEGSVPR